MTDDQWDYGDTEDKPEDEAEPSVKYEIMNYPADTTLQGYRDMWDRKELKVPPFQRRFVWDQVRASKLIESFLLGLPVPGVFLFKPRDNAEYLIIDGQQRITSIISYMKGAIDDRVFRLKNISDQWKGKTYEELSEDDQFKLKGCVLRSTIIQQINPSDNSSIYHIFERLNTGGVNLNPMEIRQCVSHGPFIESLIAMNEDENWRLLIGKEKTDKRLRDVELILRCVALSTRLDDYEKPMKSFLNNHVEIEKKTPTDYEQMQQNFSNICQCCADQLGEKPFHLRGRINYGLLDAIISTLMIVGPIGDLRHKVDSLIADEEFFKAITINTSDEKEMRQRLGAAKLVLL